MKIRIDAASTFENLEDFIKEYGERLSPFGLKVEGEVAYITIDTLKELFEVVEEAGSGLVVEIDCGVPIITIYDGDMD